MLYQKSIWFQSLCYIASVCVVASVEIPDCNDDDGVENISDKELPSAVSIEFNFRNRTAVGFQWNKPSGDTSDLCGYVVYWFATEIQMQEYHSIHDPNTTSYIISNLHPETTYTFFVASHYARDHPAVESWKVSVTTQGCGVDGSGSCKNDGSNGTYKNVSSGECLCYNDNTHGDCCDECDFSYYMNFNGCTKCDNCLMDNIASSGNCTRDTDPELTMLCDCIHPYKGKHCNECVKGFYLKDGMCQSCNCNDNEDKTTESVCEEETGKCTCSVATKGDSCDECADGFEGNAIKQSCTRTRSAGVMVLIIFLIIIIIIIVIGAGYLVYRRCLRNRSGQELWKFYRRDRHDKVNFSTLEEETDYKI